MLKSFCSLNVSGKLVAPISDHRRSFFQTCLRLNIRFWGQDFSFTSEKNFFVAQIKFSDLLKQVRKNYRIWSDVELVLVCIAHSTFENFNMIRSFHFGYAK